MLSAGLRVLRGGFVGTPRAVAVYQHRTSSPRRSSHAPSNRPLHAHRSPFLLVPGWAAAARSRWPAAAATGGRAVRHRQPGRCRRPSRSMAARSPRRSPASRSGPRSVDQRRRRHSRRRRTEVRVEHQALERGQTYNRTFAKPGVYPYSCSLHPGMAGSSSSGRRRRLTRATSSRPSPWSPRRRIVGRNGGATGRSGRDRPARWARLGCRRDARLRPSRRGRLTPV